MGADDHPSGLPSFRRLYLELADPTEYKQACELVGGWAHWQALLRSKWFSDYIAELRDELTVKLRSEGILKMRDVMNNDDKPTPAARFFADGEFKEKKGRGRPSKAEREQLLKEEAAIDKKLQEDAERLGLKLVQ